MDQTNKIRNHIYQYDQVVIGGTIEAVFYAYVRDLPLISCAHKMPSHFDFLDHQYDLNDFGFDNKELLLKTPAGEEKFGSLKRNFYEHLMFFLSLAGNVPLSNKAQSIRIGQENTLRVSTPNSRFAKFKFDELIIFDDVGVHGIPNEMTSQGEEKYKILDWMNIASGMRQEIDYIKLEDSFVNEIYLYPSDRIDGKHLSLKDCAIISYIDYDDLQKFEYSDTYVKFKALKILKSFGMRGARNGRSKEDPTKFKYYALKLDSVEREFFDLNYNVYKDSKSIKFNYSTMEEIMAKSSITKNNKPQRFQQRFFEE